MGARLCSVTAQSSQAAAHSKAVLHPGQDNAGTWNTGADAALHAVCIIL